MDEDVGKPEAATPAQNKSDEPDPRASLKHVLATEPSPNPPTPSASQAQASETPKGAASPDNDNNAQSANAAITTSIRRNPNGSVSSVYSGNRIRYLKKDDGLPFWRRDIQFTFLRAVFEDKTKEFTKFSDGTTGHTFTEIYVDAMAKSSKCSQILKEKLLSESSEQAIDMAMVCLLVNVGRMNTTVNFFPEMRARVRTFHSIPCLQAHQGPQAYKQLQDGPRLKSILKGATEDTPQPSTVEELMRQSKPRTNPVSLIFVLAQYAPKISELHFPASREFFDIFMRDTLSSRSRAKAFLWIMWWYLESDFSAEAARNNPFGEGQPGRSSDMPVQVPAFETLTEEEAAKENEDPQEELDYGEAKRIEREAILANDMPPTVSAPKRGYKTAMMEQQHNYRFRASSFSGSNSDSGRSRGRRSRSPEHNNGKSRRYREDRDQTQSQSPARGLDKPPDDKHYVGMYGKRGVKRSAGKDRTVRKGPGRGNYPRKPRNHPILPFEQMQSFQSGQSSRPPPMYHFGPDNTATPVLASSSNANGGSSGFHAVNGYAQENASGSAAQTSGGKRSRPMTHYQQLIERNRRERIGWHLDHNMRAMQKAKRTERKHRGILLDAWVKARALPDGWDSEEDEWERTGGLDDIKYSNGEGGSGKTGTGNPNLMADFDTGDIGWQSNNMAKTWKKVAKACGIEELVDRKRRKSRGKGKDREREQEDEDPESYPSNQAADFSQDMNQSPDPAAPTVEDDASTGTPTKTKRKSYVRRPRQAVSTEQEQPAFSWVPKGRKRTDPSKNDGSLRPGEMGIPTDVFFGNGASDGRRRGTGPRKTRGKRRTSQGIARGRKQSKEGGDSSFATEQDATPREKAVSKRQQKLKGLDREPDQGKAGEDTGEVDQELLAEVDADGTESGSSGERKRKREPDDEGAREGDDMSMVAEPEPAQANGAAETGDVAMAD